jgi:hypothetical protein
MTLDTRLCTALRCRSRRQAAAPRPWSRVRDLTGRQAQPLDRSPTVHCCWMVIGKSIVCPELWSRVKGPPK